MNDFDEEFEHKLESLLFKAKERSENKFINVDPETNKEIEDQIKTLLKNFEVVSEAKQEISKISHQYTVSLYKRSIQIAEEDDEKSYITKAHVDRAKVFIKHKNNKFDFSDLWINAGSLFVGSFIPHLLELIQNKSQPNIILIILGVVGALCFGLGLKSKQ